ncbi:hypothetical protein NCER_100535 [Vairimorpha ceranae BRL01]|uniref:Uncharacterized protein n=2 Tax=Vairimorpha ceranae TaxID=40302 RepID=C4V7U4_VAIC1|nr:inorganic polyphosphate atp-nad kinase [Vairimorpha ceranae]EEQ82718.1 hypothetical protein NCER_100535 [Vairimorpha ceranae BRL01]KAF5139911.1 hypothetical protein G9O61_00g019300 [Vairimorpha ceranae]KKO74437.1 inorganic polyphosphate atp-nad kinase [Vairimorpha ceranae]
MFLLIIKDKNVDYSPFKHLSVDVKILEEIKENIFDLDFYRAVIILGGDGTILRAVQKYKVLPPIIAINYGTYGFLTTFCKTDFINKKPTFNINSMYGFKRNRLLINNNIYFLNEIVLTSRVRRLNTFCITVKNKIDKFTVRGDSLIISTMTGSSAYNHSIMGPTLLDDNCYIINVVAPCKSLFRPLICNITDEVTVTCNDAICLVDGKEYNYDTIDVSWDGNFVTFLSDRKINIYGSMVNLIQKKD